MLSDAGDDQLGGEQVAMALPILKEIASQFPSVPRYRENLAKAHRDYAQILGFMKKPDEAKTEFEEAINIHKRLVQEHPTVLPYQAEIGVTSRMRGDLAYDSGQLPDALAWYDKAIEILTAVHVQDREYTLARNSLSNSHAGRAKVRDRLKRHGEAQSDWTRALELCPDRNRYGFRCGTADSKLRAGKVEEAIAEVEELESIENDNPTHWFRFAKLYAVAGEKVPARKDEFADHALELLRKAVANGFNDAKRIRDDDELTPLRQRDDFQRLMRAIDAATTKKPGAE